MYDTIIIGAGPAGMAAGIYAVRREMKTLILGQTPGGQVVWASEIENYPGFRRIMSDELISKWRHHVTDLGAEMKIDEVRQINRKNDSFILSTQKSQYEAKTVIIAMGLVPRRLAIPGEEKMTGRGVSYCANCDSPFYRGKKVVVVGGGNAALDAAELLSKIAKDVILVHRRQEFRAFEALVNEVVSKENIKILYDSEVSSIQGENKVEKVTVKNIKNGTVTDLAVDGVFIEIGRIAHTDLVSDLVERNERNQIIVDEKCRTKTPGVFAAGDVTNVPYKQISIAIGQATIAALAAYEFLQLKQGKPAGTITDRSVPKKK